MKPWQRVEVTLSLVGQKYAVEGESHPDVPGLAVTPFQPIEEGPVVAFDGSPLYCITHLKSGLRIRGPWMLHATRRRLFEIGKLTDWTKSQAKIRNLGLKSTVCAKLGEQP